MVSSGRFGSGRDEKSSMIWIIRNFCGYECHFILFHFHFISWHRVEFDDGNNGYRLPSYSLCFFFSVLYCMYIRKDIISGKEPWIELDWNHATVLNSSFFKERKKK